MKTLKDARITKAIVNEQKELQVHMIVKDEDYDESTAELLRRAKIDGNTLDFVLDGLTLAESENERKKALQTLFLTMKEYAMKFHIDEDAIKQNLYKRYQIQSRTELTLPQIHTEIESYKASILSGIA